MLFLGTTHAQEKTNLKCTMSVDDILRVQPFDIDEPISETAGYIFADLIEELEIVYDKVDESNTNGLQKNIEKIQEILKSAKEIELNYTMFDKDLEFIESLK